MKIQTFNRLAQTITLALVCSTTISAQAAILIGAGVRNGDFNDDTSATDGRSFADTPFWENIGTGDQSAQCTRLNNAYDGTRNAVLAGGGARIPGQDTGHDLAVGESFLVGYVWGGFSGWDLPFDQVVIRLFTTDNDLIGGVRTDIAEAFAPFGTVQNTYEAVVDEDFGGYSVPASLAGKRLFLEIGVTAGGSEFARFDNLVLEAIPSTVLTWVGGGGNTWDTSSLVWSNTVFGVLTNYNDGALVTFDDTSANRNVTVVGTLSPGGVTVSNTAGAYTFTGGGISGGGDLVKQGTSSLILNNIAVALSGKTVIEGGTLLADSTSPITLANLSGSGALVHTGSGALTVSSAGFDGSVTVESGSALRVDGTATIATLTIESGATSLAIVDADDGLAPVIAENYTNSASPLVINYSGAGIIPGVTRVLIDYGSNSVVGTYTLTVPAGVTASLVTNEANTSIDVVITGVTPDRIWAGTTDGNWDTFTANWLGGTTYTDGQKVRFDNSGANTAITVISAVVPSLMWVSNSTTPYSFSGSAISTPSLVKQGSGTLAFNQQNNFTNLSLQAGAVSYEGGSFITESGTVSGSGTLRVDGSFTQLTLNGDMSGFNGPIQVNAGQLKLGADNVLGTPNGTTTIANGALLDVNSTSNLGEQVIVSGSGPDAFSGVVVNTGATTEDFALSHLTLAGDSVIGATTRWAISNVGETNGILDTTGGTYSLTKRGLNTFLLRGVDVGPGIGNITVEQGRFTVQGTTDSLGNPASTMTVWNEASVSFFASPPDSPANPINKVLVMDGGSLVNKGGSATDVVFAGPVTLNGTVTNNADTGLLTFTGPVGGFGSVIKTGSAAIALLGANTYQGGTRVEQGTLRLSTQTTDSGFIGISVASGATFGVVVTAAGTTLTTPNLALTNGATLEFGFGTLGNPTAPVMSATALTNAGDYNVAINTSVNELALTGGTPITLLQYPAGTVTNQPATVTFPAGLVGVVTNNTAVSQIQLTITAVSRALTWVGDDAVNPDRWDIGTTINWLAGESASTYRELGAGDFVTFPETASNFTVNVTQPVSPAGVTVTGTNDYSMGGASAIAGPGTLTMNGTGTLTLTSGNTYFGGTTLSAGKVELANAAALGTGTVALGGGALSSDSGTARALTNTVTLTSDTSALGDAVNNGALTFSGPFDFGAGARDVTINSAVTLSGTIATNSSLDQKSGPGTLTLLGITGVIGGGGNWQIEDGNLVVDGGDIDKSGGGIRVNSRVTNGLSRVQIANGASMTMSGTAQNARVGSTGGDVTATNILDLAGTLTWTTNNPGAAVQMGEACALAQFNLNAGGLLRVGGFAPVAGGVTRVNLNGGTLAPSQSTAAFMEGLSNVTINALGVVIDTEGFDITINQNMGGAGGLTKSGDGKLNLNSQSYAGDTVVNGGILGGNQEVGGTVLQGNLVVNAGGTISPGASIGKIYAANPAKTVTVAGAATMEIAKTGASSFLADLVQSEKSIGLSGTLNVTFDSSHNTALVVGNSFQLFQAPTATGGVTGGFGTLNLPTVDPIGGNLLTWNTGSVNFFGQTIWFIEVTSVTPPIVTDPPPTLSAVVANGNYELNWGSEYTGYTLQSQTNALSVGLDMGSWVSIPGTESMNSYSVPIDPANPTVFFQLVYTNAP